MKLHTDFYTATGGRAHNEDAAVALAQDGACLCLVADGLGGHGGGEIASRVAAGEIERRFLVEGPALRLEEAVLAANRQVTEKQRELHMKMKTTVAAALVTERGALLAHVGDSRIYLLKKGKTVFRTADHSAARLAVDLGEITEEQLRGYEDRNVLTRALGAGGQVRVEAAWVPGGAFDHVLVCSDGFWEYVLEEEIERAACAEPAGWLEDMRACHAQRAPAGCDNHTAVVLAKEEEEEREVL